MLSTYRELLVRNRRNYYAQEIGKVRVSLAKVTAESTFMLLINKFVIEIAIVVSAALISMIQFALQDASNAVASLTIFLASGSRIAPSILRVQQGAIQIKASLGQSLPTLNLIDEIGLSDNFELKEEEIDFIHEGFAPSLELENVSFRYPNSKIDTLKNISLTIESGSFVAFVGPSGGGKSTLIDLMLGVLHPDSGEVLISGLRPLDAISRWPGAISNVPQDVTIIKGTIRENIGAGFPCAAHSEGRMRETLLVSRLNEFVMQLPLGLDTQVGERGEQISGGQRQRLGIARAMFTNPKLLVLDEATSALDGMTEAEISNELLKLNDSVTLVMAAHRLSTVKQADLVVYLANGEVQAVGTFEQVRNQVTDFDKQAGLMGL